MEHGTPVYLSTTSCPAPRSVEDQERPEQSYPSASRLDEESVVHGTSGYEHLSSDQAAASGGSSVAAAEQGPAPGPAQSSSPYLEIEPKVVCHSGSQASIHKIGICLSLGKVCGLVWYLAD